jgi:hypothetical protein
MNTPSTLQMNTSVQIENDKLSSNSFQLIVLYHQLLYVRNILLS